MADLVADLHDIARKHALAEILGRQNTEKNSRMKGSKEIWPLIRPIITRHAA